MAEQVDFQNKTALRTGYNRDNMLRTKTQQYYNTSNSGYLDGPKQGHSRMQLGHADQWKIYGSTRPDNNVKHNGVSAYRKRSENVDRLRVNAVLGEGQLVNTGGVLDNRAGMSIPRGGVQNQKELLNKGMENYSRKETSDSRDCSRRRVDDEHRLENPSNSLSARNHENTVPDVRSSSELIINQNSSLQNKSESSYPIDVGFSDRKLKPGIELRSDESRIVSRSGSLDRRKVQVKQTNIGVENPAKAFVDKVSVKPRENERADREGSKLLSSTQRPTANVRYSGVRDGSTPTVKLQPADQRRDTQIERNNRYAKCFVSTGELATDTTPSSQLGNHSGIVASHLRHSFQEGDRRELRKMDSNLSNRIGMIRKQSGEYLHARQGSDPTSQFSGARKLSGMSQDLMRSKEELINRSKECGRMLEEYRQREEERREQIARNDKRSDPPPKTTGSKLVLHSKEKEDHSTGNSVPHERKLLQTQITDDEPGKQSPRYGKRKTSYIDSWIQSQQSRISSLASAIKEEDSDDNSRVNKGTGDQLTKFGPKDSLSFLSWGRRDDLEQEADDSPVDNIVHTRSHSSNEIMGIVESRESPKRSSKASNGAVHESGVTKVTSPRDGRTSYDPDDMRARSLFVQKEAYSRAHQRDNGSMPPFSPKSPIELRNFEGKYKSNNVPSSRSQSERTSPQLQRSFESAKSNSVGNSPRQIREIKVVASIQGDNFPDPEASPISPRPATLRRSSSASDYTRKERQQQQLVTSQEQLRRSFSPRSSLTRRSSSSGDNVTRNKQQQHQQNQQHQQQQQQVVSPCNSLSRRSSSSSLKHSRTSSCSTPIEQSKVDDDNRYFAYERSMGTNIDASRYNAVYQYDHHQSNTPDRSGNEDQFDWPAPPDLEESMPGDDAQNQSWPSSCSSPFMNRNLHAEGSRHFPVAVVKPLQHEKTQSWDGTLLQGDTHPPKFTNSGEFKQNDQIVYHAARNDTIACYNVHMKDAPTEKSRHLPQGISSPMSLPRDHLSIGSQSLDNSSSSISFPRDHSSNASLPHDGSSTSSQEIINERYIGGSRYACDSSEELYNADKGISNLITQDFQWYRPPSQSSSNVMNLERDSTRESVRDSTQERLGRFKRGSKLLSSKYQSFSKSLENLSKVGKDLIKGKKKGEKDEKKEEKKKEKSHKNRPERKSMVLGNLELNDEFAMKMERKSRLSAELAGNSDEFSKGPSPAETRQTNIGGSKLVDSGAGETSLKKKETVIDFPLIPTEAMPEEKSSSDYIDKEMSVEPERNIVELRNRRPRDEVVRRREIKSAYFGESEGRRVHSRPKSEFFDYDYDHRYGDFEDYDDDSHDEEEKEMVKIVRKISGLRSSQFKKKSPSKQDGKDSSHDDRTESDQGISIGEAESELPVGSDEDATRAAEEAETVETERRRSPELTGHDNATKEEPKEDPSPEVVRTRVKTRVDANSNLDRDPVKRISTSLSRVMTDLRELREQDLDLATQLITLGKSIKHFKNQKKEMDSLYAIINDGETTDCSDSSYDEEEEEEDGRRWSGPNKSCFGSRITTDF